ncbi:MAG: hypothetical protein ACLP3K_07570 [Candidatus Acidiferrales bacterium]
MATGADIIAELGFVTDRLSGQVRTTALGALALSWGLLIGESATAQALAAQLKWHLVGVGAAAILVLFCDVLQYVAGYVATLGVYRKMQKAGKNEGSYDESALPFRLRMVFFYLKMVVLSVTVVWLLVALGHWLLAAR